MKLMTMQTRVFVVYMNTALVSRLFALADQNGMMSKGYAWIITAGLSNSLNVLDSDVVDSMDGVLGVRAAEKILPPTNPSFVKPNTSKSRTDLVVGYWTPEKGISQNIGSNYKNGLKQIIWPGDSTTTPTGWAIPSLKIGVPVKLGFPEFVEQRKNGNKTTYTGFSIDVFSTVSETLNKDLGFKVLHNFIGFEDETGLMDGSYDDLLLQIKNKGNWWSETALDKLEPTFDNLERLRTKDHFIGFQRGCFVGNLLEKQFNFSRSQLKSYGTIQEYHEALSNGSKNRGVTAIFDEIPYVRVFLKAYDSQYTTAGLIYRTVGFGFAFLKESPLFSYFSKVILLVREIETKMDEIEKRYFGEKVTSATLAPTIYTESSSLRAYNFGGLFIIAGMATLLAITVSERFIWQRPVALVRQYLTSNHPANGIELAAQPTAETDAGDHSSEVHQASGNSGRISVHIKEDIAVE
ncbi:glutamate receptor [Citrus sinensis]|nr:glutamate receptor [Citrus sinensis]